MVLQAVSFDISAAQDDKQPRFRPTGLDFNIGLVDPDNSNSDLVLGGTRRMGSIFRRWLRLSTGFSTWSTDGDSTHFGPSREGTLTDSRVFADLRLNLFKWKIVRPYVMGGAALHFVSADIPSDQVLQDALSSTNAGWELGMGVVVGRRWRATGEVRKEFVSDVGNWSFTAGLGVLWGDVPPPDRDVPPPEPDEGASATNQVIETLHDDLVEMSLFYPQTASVRDAETGVRIIVPASALFAPDDSFLDPGSVGELSKLASFLRDQPVSSITIEGYTARGEDPEAEILLSRRRAEAVKQILSASGIEEDRIHTVGNGAARPVASNDTPEGRARNRRMEIILTVE
jgi:outer membrane protein OmpA-like peptidoglycan-associated protein